MLLLDNVGWLGWIVCWKRDFQPWLNCWKWQCFIFLDAVALASVRSAASFDGSGQIMTTATRLERLLLLLAGFGRTNR